jgi:murein L,D-transpeptidase YafK
VIRTFEDISIGRYGVTRDRKRDDHRTPVGRFRIAWISDDSAFHRFLGLDYPDLESARRAYAQQRIAESDWRAIQAAHRSGEVPPQDTPLGGQIGIHGIGQGSPLIHDSYNWTNGCVALTNEELDELMQWVKVGTRVDVR